MLGAITASKAFKSTADPINLTPPFIPPPTRTHAYNNTLGITYEIREFSEIILRLSDKACLIWRKGKGLLFVLLKSFGIHRGRHGQVNGQQQQAGRRAEGHGRRGGGGGHQCSIGRENEASTLSQDLPQHAKWGVAKKSHSQSPSKS